MTPIERIKAVCRGELPDRVPFVLLLREFALKHAGVRFVEAYRDPDAYVRAQVKVLQDFRLDAVCDLFVTPAVDEALGAKIVFPDDDPPWIPEPSVATTGDLDKFAKLDPLSHGRMPYLLDIVSRLKREVGPDIPVLAWPSVPFRTACMLMGSQELYRGFYKKPEFVSDLIEACYEPCLAYGKALLDAGADIIFTSNPTASTGCISRQHYEAYAHATTRDMHTALKAHGADTIIFHPCGTWHDRLDLLADIGADVLHFDKVEIAAFKSQYADKCVYMGNVGTVDTLLSGTVADVENEAQNCLEKGAGGGRYILSADCIVPRDTDPAHLSAMADVVERHGGYG
jgi:uroporphyrinogen decarboxylase